MKTNEPKAQILLLIPKDWIEELNVLAESRFISRLSLIRSYLRQSMDKDFSQYAEQLSERERLLKTRSKLKTFIDDRN